MAAIHGLELFWGIMHFLGYFCCTFSFKKSCRALLLLLLAHIKVTVFVFHSLLLNIKLWYLSKSVWEPCKQYLWICFVVFFLSLFCVLDKWNIPVISAAAFLPIVEFNCFCDVVYLEKDDNVYKCVKKWNRTICENLENKLKWKWYLFKLPL